MAEKSTNNLSADKKSVENDSQIGGSKTTDSIQRGFDLLGASAGAVQLKGELGTTLEHAELSGIGEERLGLDAIELKIPGKGWYRF